MDFLTTVWHTLLHVLFPQSTNERNALQITPEKLIAKAQRARHDEVLKGIDGSALFSYKDPLVRDMVWLLKYQGNRAVAKTFAHALYATLLEDLSDLELLDQFTKPVLIPIPLSKKRLRKRGFNQSKLVAKALIANAEDGILEIETKCLVRVKDTLSQTSLKSKSERRDNVRDCFRVVESCDIAGRNILLLDDVITTGATMHEAQRTLRASGARSVKPIALAH